MQAVASVSLPIESDSSWIASTVNRHVSTAKHDGVGRTNVDWWTHQKNVFCCLSRAINVSSRMPFWMVLCRRVCELLPGFISATTQILGYTCVSQSSLQIVRISRLLDFSDKWAVLTVSFWNFNAMCANLPGLYHFSCFMLIFLIKLTKRGLPVWQALTTWGLCWNVPSRAYQRVMC